MTGPLADGSDAAGISDAEARIRRWQLGLDATGLGLWDWDILSGAFDVDERWAQMVGYARSELEPVDRRTWTQLCHPDDLVATQTALERYLAGATPVYDVTCRMQHRDGHWVWVRNRGQFVAWTSEGRPQRMFGVQEDVSQSVADTQALEKSQAQLRQAQRIANLGSWYLDVATGHVEWTDELFRMLGLDPAGTAPDYINHGDLFTPDSWALLSSTLAVTQEQGIPYELELEMVRPDGSHGWMLARGEADRDRSGAIVGVRGVALDITARRQAEDELRSLTTRDQLTGLANRTAAVGEIDRALRAAQRSGRSTAVLLVDLDGFKRVNDSLGHSVGDQILVQAATRLEDSVRGGDLVGRIGGDEFIVVMRDLMDPAEAIGVASRVVERFRSPFVVDGADLHVTASAGIARSSANGGAEELLRDADTAMYGAKAAGRDRVLAFDQALRDQVTRRMSIETELRRAMEVGQFEVYYQPEIRFADSCVIAVEALLRWHHPDGELYTADRFIDVAEDSGIIAEIGSWVLDQACHQAATWARERPEQPMAMRVNVSAVQMGDGSLLSVIDAALASSGLSPEMLCVEITETVLLRDTDTVRRNLAGIHERGINIAVDDFGTGYASLTYLHRYPVDLVKIDRSFVTNITNSDNDRQLVAGIIAMTGLMGYAVMAEGVETAEQARVLRDLGCPSAQGFLFSAAVPAADVPRYAPVVVGVA